MITLARVSATGRRVLIPVLSTLLLGGCIRQTERPTAQAPTLQRIAFGSCSRETMEQPLWGAVAASRPDLWIWMGDNVYADTHDMSVMAQKYALAKSNPGYQRLLAGTPAIGTWDDHDYGLNDGGREYAQRAQSQQLLLDFLDEPRDSPRRRRAGVYEAYTYGTGSRQVKVILLDTRYHRDPIGSGGTVLGEEQWAWLERELRGSRARINVIVSSIQVIADEHRWEKWSNFPAERERLLRLIADARTPGVILLSGDRHHAEIMRLEDPRIGYPLYEVTSSGLTHVGSPRWEPNRHRLGDMLVELNWGMMEVDWSDEPSVRLQIRNADNAVRLEQRVALRDLRPR